MALPLAAIGLVVVVPAGIVRADSLEAPYDASAQANAVNIATTNPTFPLGLLIEGGGPQANVRMTSLQQSDASASFPYLGNSLPTAPGLAASIVGLPLPNIPTTLTSGFGDGPKAANFPGVALRAESGSASTLASATAGNGGLGGAVSTSRVDITPEGGVVSRAETSFSGLEFGGLVSLAGFRSESQVSSDSATGKLTRFSTLSIGRLSAPGLALAIPVGNVPPPFGGQTIAAPDIGFKDGQFTVTLPYLGEQQTFDVPAQSVLDAFKALGVTLEYQPASSGSTSIQGAQFVIKTTLPSPPPNQGYNGETPVTYTLGQTLANVTVSGVSGAADALSGAGGAGGAGGVSGAGDTSAEGVLPGQGSSLSGVDAAGVLPSTTAPAPQVTGSVPVPAGSLAAARFEPVVADSQAGRFYFALALAALVAFVSMSAVRLLGVRLKWES